MSLGLPSKIRLCDTGLAGTLPKNPGSLCGVRALGSKTYRIPAFARYSGSPILCSDMVTHHSPVSSRQVCCTREEEAKVTVLVAAFLYLVSRAGVGPIELVSHRTFDQN